MIKTKIIFILLIVLLPHAAAAMDLSAQHVERLRRARQLLDGVETRTVEDIADDLRQTADPGGNVQIYEAVAATYSDLVSRKNITGEEEKRDLYNQIRLNAAFIQFGGDPDGGGKKLDRWIRQALMRHLPRELLDNKKMFHSADEWNK